MESGDDYETVTMWITWRLLRDALMHSVNFQLLTLNQVFTRLSRWNDNCLHFIKSCSLTYILRYCLTLISRRIVESKFPYWEYWKWWKFIDTLLWHKQAASNKLRQKIFLPRFSNMKSMKNRWLYVFLNNPQQSDKRFLVKAN